MIQIKHRLTDEVLYESATATTIAEALLEAIGKGANLYGANLYGANLESANLYGANLESANLVRANLHPIQQDFDSVLFAAAAEIPGLRLALIEGRVDGSTYTGDCACLVGTIAKVRCESPYGLKGLKPDMYRPIERFFLAIKPGDTPENSQFAKLAVEWIDDFQARLDAVIASLGYAKAVQA